MGEKRKNCTTVSLYEHLKGYQRNYIIKVVRETSILGFRYYGLPPSSGRVAQYRCASLYVIGQQGSEDQTNSTSTGRLKAFWMSYSLFFLKHCKCFRVDTED